MYALVDCNNFYVSCERVFNPALNGKAVVVLSNNDGCVISRSNEAKALGIKMAAPAFKIAGFLKANGVEVYSSNYALYGDLSRRVMATLGELAPELEIYSIDEAFLDLTGLPVRLAEYGQRIRSRIWQCIGIPVSVGIGPTKVLAKLANHFAKQLPEHRGVFVFDPARAEEILRKLAVEEIWGIGWRRAAQLTAYNVRTAWDLVQLPDDWVRQKLTVVGLRVKKELEGVSCLELESAPPPKKAICTSRSFGQPQTTQESIKEAVAAFAEMCAFKLRQQHSCATVLMVFIHTNEFIPHEPQYARNLARRLPVATNSSLELIRYAVAALEAIFQEGYRYKKAGVIVSELIPDVQAQGALFDAVDREKQRELMKAMDRINLRFGQGTLQIAAQGVGDRKWKMRQAKLSPGYTTRWSDVIAVKSEG